jgi:Arc/MetJ-type ribon-helix-helix transcriptional regulator
MMMCNTGGFAMSVAKIAVTMEKDLLAHLDRLVARQVFPNRSQAVQVAVREQLRRMRRSRFARECAKLDPAFERALAEECLSGDIREWPEY